MWYSVALLVASAALTLAVAAPASTRAPLRTLDRQASELAWRSWLQSPEQSNPNTPPRRIITKSLFITPLVCPKGQRLDRDGCVQVVTVNKDEHTAILLEELQKLFTAPPTDLQYDYGDLLEEQQGPVQVNIPIGPDPQAQPLLANEQTAQAQEIRPDYLQIDKKEENKPVSDAASIEAELELLKLQVNDHANITKLSEPNGILNHNVLNNNFLPVLDKPKRDSPASNVSEESSTRKETKEEGQKEIVYGQVNVDPILYHIEGSSQTTTTNEPETEIPTTAIVEDVTMQPNATTITINRNNINKNMAETTQTSPILKGDQNKLNPENDYADIGEAIKLISRYAAVTTDDNFAKDQKKYAYVDDDILGTRTKQQYRRNKPKTEQSNPAPKKSAQMQDIANSPENAVTPTSPKAQVFYRYSWPNHPKTPPPDYPFRRLQDYWPNWKQTSGVYNMAHENPKRHHHPSPHSGFRTRGYPINLGSYPVNTAGYPVNFGGLAENFGYPGRLDRLPAPPQYRVPTSSVKRPRTNNQDVYSLLGLRHWISSEGTSKR